MQSAMKLPPHILPTLDELDPTTSSLNTVRDKNMGVYGKLNNYVVQLLKVAKSRRAFYFLFHLQNESMKPLSIINFSTNAHC